MAVDSSGLVRAAMMLRGEAPAAWTGFLGAFDEYANAMAQEMLKCSPDMLSKAQGMALMARELNGILVDAPKTFDKIQQVQRGRPDGRRPNATGF